MYKHSGYPGGLKETPYSRLMAEKPERALEAAVRGMLPKNRLGRKMIKKLKVLLVQSIFTRPRSLKFGISRKGACIDNG